MNSKWNVNHRALIFQMYANILNITWDSKIIKYKKVESYLYTHLFLKFKATQYCKECSSKFCKG